MIIKRIAEKPQTETPDEIIRFMVQSLSFSEISLMNFLVGLWSFYNRNGYLTERQHEALCKVFSEFTYDLNVQFPATYTNNYQGETLQ